MSDKRVTILFVLLTVVIAVLSLYRSGCWNSTAIVGTSLQAASVMPEGLNHLFDNTASDLDQTKRLESTIKRFMAQWEIEGASLAIMKDGKLVYSKGFGFADSERKVAMDVKHIFRIASLSKLITATGIMKLTQSGRLSLNDKVFGSNGILNDSLYLDITDKRVTKITVEDLLRHRGGYSVRAGDPLFSSANVASRLDTSLPLSMSDMVRYASLTRLRYDPGSANSYSNLGYVILSKVIEKVSGMSYEAYIKDSIMTPIGCYDMHIGSSSRAGRFPNEVCYYEPSDADSVLCFDGSGQIVPRRYGGCDLSVLSGAGGWVASPTELMKFITAIDPDDSKPDILNAKTISYMIEKDKKRYPIGWMRTTAGNDWSRTGTLAGSSAMLKRQHNGYTWVFITNTSSWSGSKFPAKIDVMIRQALNKVKEWPDRDLFETATATNSESKSTSHGGGNYIVSKL